MKNKPKNIPHTPGIYFFKKGKTIIYIGKANNLKERISSYFSKQNIDPRKIDMVHEATALSWQETLSDAEALIREAELIKKYAPQYNIVMRDDKQYFYVGFSRSTSSGQAHNTFPRIFLTHQPHKKLRVTSYELRDYIGPFTDGASLKQTLKLLRRAFPYCTCKEKHKRVCQHASIGNCLGICCTRSPHIKALFPDYGKRASQYKKNVRIIKNILSGKGKKMIQQMQKNMVRLSRIQQYEKAALARDQLYALENIFSHKHIIKREETVYAHKGITYLKNALHLKKIPHRIEAFDISNIQGIDAVGSMIVFTGGEPNKNEYRKFKIRTPERPNDVGMIKEIVSRRLSNAWTLPDIMVIDGGKTQLNTAKNALRNFQFQILNSKSIFNFQIAKKITKIEVVALAKREEELYLSNNRIIKLKEGPAPLLHLLQYIRNEAHRFAITYHKKRRRQRIGN